jgi:hypothetical protein
MSKHLATCEQRQAAWQKLSADAKAKPVKVFHLLVSGAYATDYWIHLDMPAKATLQELDQFLRDTWLECCGHLSRFSIDGVGYASYPMEEFDEKGMGSRLEKVLEPGMEFEHEYDYGSTTELTLKVVGVREGPFKGNAVQVMARNEMPVWQCQVCGKNVATEICVECIYNDEGLLCDKCAKKHKCGEEMLLPVVNSPRVGVCGYTGDEPAYDD